MPPNKPDIIEIPEMSFVAVRGQGNPNNEDGEYKTAIGLLYAIAYTVRMSYKSNYEIEGYFEYVVPPLEGFWWQEDIAGVVFSRKDTFQWISVIRLPVFVTEKDFEWAKEQATKKKKQNYSKVEFYTYNEGLCVQCMHIGAYDDEPATILAMEEFAASIGYQIDISNQRFHHQIYLSDPRRTDVSKLKTVVRHPIKGYSTNY